MIDPSIEPLIPFARLAGELPRRRAGRKTSVATLYRWSSRGCRGVKLEYLQVGATRCTSREALARFFAALTAQSQGAPIATMPAPTAARQRAIERVDHELDELGV